jgi:cell wall-associated NlpC family hydrolase
MVSLGMLSTIVATTASADTVASKKAEASRIATQLNSLAERASILDENYNEARVKAADADAKARNAAMDLASTTAKTQSANEALKKMSVSAYMRGGLKAAATLPANGDPSRAQYYLQSAANGQRDAIDQLKAARQALLERQAGLTAAQQQARRELSQMNAKRKAAADAEGAQRALLSKVQGDLAHLVAAEQAKREQAAARPNARPAAGRGAPARTGSGGSTSPRAPRNGNIGSPPAGDNPAPNAAAQGAVNEAKKQLGKPYHYGAGGPDSFDCSGLTSYVWRVGGGRSLPHSSRAQYSATSRIPLSEIAPGDLVFFGSSVGSIHHVGIYVGGGQMINAPETGEVVRYQYAFRGDLVGVGRVN